MNKKAKTHFISDAQLSAVEALSNAWIEAGLVPQTWNPDNFRKGNINECAVFIGIHGNTNGFLNWVEDQIVKRQTFGSDPKNHDGYDLYDTIEGRYIDAKTIPGNWLTLNENSHRMSKADVYTNAEFISKNEFRLRSITHQRFEKLKSQSETKGLVFVNVDKLYYE
jgi:hypothetical protein